MKKSKITEMPLFYDRYINLVSEEVTVLEGLSNSQNSLEDLKDLLEKHQNFEYEQGKWTPKDILQHIIDTERIMSYRALCLARGEKQQLLGFEQDDYAKNTKIANRTIESLLQEFYWVRSSTLAMFKSFSDEMLLREGTCSGIQINCLALGFVCVGHVQHHINVLHEKYFNVD